ncbi:MAG TPA: dethiobiotin synthase [Rhodospirillales bacterium]|jgi:dethiobiotin synthase|nr:dethiobiotin synthase [Rhodospirillales bacterium]
MKGVFVTGTDTGIGKTVVSAWLVHHMEADYWKPVQAGLADGTDAEAVRRLAGLGPDRIHPSAYELNAPLSPHEAARLDGVHIRMERIVRPRAARPLVVEGAGGLLVPLNKDHFIIDLIALCKLPAILVSRSGLGTINHSLLSIEAMRRRDISIAGIVLIGPENPGNHRTIEEFGRVKVIATLPPLDPLNKEALAAIPLDGGLLP